MDTHVSTVLGFVDAAQVVLATFGSPDGPTDPLECYDIIGRLLEDKTLLEAQTALKAGG
jgi:hypothetical protein